MDFRALLCHQWGLCGYYEPNLCVFGAIINSKSETVRGAYYDLLLAKKQHGKTCKDLIILNKVRKGRYLLAL